MDVTQQRAQSWRTLKGQFLSFAAVLDHDSAWIHTRLIGSWATCEEMKQLCILKPERNTEHSLTVAKNPYLSRVAKPNRR